MFRKTVCASLVFLLIPANLSAEDWPYFLGPRHDGTSAERKLDLQWPETGLKVLWKQQIGTGYSAPSVLGECLVVHHRVKDEEIISCRSVATGEEIWSEKYESKFSDPYGYNNGPRCSPILSDGRCITLGAEGMLQCRTLDEGKLLWSHLLSDPDGDLKLKLPDWFFGMGCSPLLDGERLIVMAGAQGNNGVIAFDVSDGRKLWSAVGEETWEGVVDRHTGQPYAWTGDEMVTSYSSPVIATIHGKRHLLCLMRQGLVSLNPEDGSQNFCYWFRPKVHESVNAARPVVVGDQILLSAAYRLGSALIEVKADGKSFDEVWVNEDNLLAHWSTPIHVDGYVYGFSGRHENEGELRCIRLSDGKVVWQTSGFSGNVRELARDRATGKIIDVQSGKPVPFPYYGRGSLIQVGDRFIVLGERGTLAIVEVDATEFRELRRASFDEIDYPAWAAPVLSNGNLFLRSEKWLLCLDLSKND